MQFLGKKRNKNYYWMHVDTAADETDFFSINRLLYLNLGNFMDQILFGGRPSVFGATFQSVIFTVFLTPNWGPPNAMVMCEKFSPFGNDYGLVGGVLFRRFLGANIAISCLG